MGNQQLSFSMEQKFNQPQQNVRDWSTGTFGCASDIKSCICGCLCLPCLMCQIATRMDENCLVGICAPGGSLGLRVKMRTLYGISGSICNDCICLATGQRAHADGSLSAHARGSKSLGGASLQITLVSNILCCVLLLMDFSFFCIFFSCYKRMKYYTRFLLPPKTM